MSRGSDAELKTPLDPPLFLARDVGLIVVQAALLPIAALVPERRWRALGHRAAAPFGRFPTPAMARRRTGIQTLIAERADPEAAAGIDHLALARRFEQALQYLRCWLPGGWQPALTLRGAEHLDRALEAGRGAVLWVAPQIDAALGVKKALCDAGHALHHLSSSYHGHSRSRFGRRFLNPVQIGAERRFLAERILQDSGGEVQTMRIATRCLRQNQLVSISCVPLGERLVRRRMLAGEMDFSPGVASLALLARAPSSPSSRPRPSPERSRSPWRRRSKHRRVCAGATPWAPWSPPTRRASKARRDATRRPR